MNTGSKQRTSTEDSEKTILAGQIILKIIGGPEAGKTFPLQGKQVILGRSSSADISLADNMLSRRHAMLINTGSGWDIVDLGSTNGSWIRGNRIQEQIPLPLNTPVRIGQTIFQLEGVESITSQEGGIDERLISYRIEPISVSDLDKRMGRKMFKEQTQADRELRQLATIYKIQSLLTTDEDEKKLYPKILEVITETIYSDIAYLLLWDESQKTVIPVAERNRFGAVEVISDEFLSFSIINYVRDKHEAVLSLDAQTDDRFNGESLEEINVRSVMCVPMMSRTSFCGMIYLISTDPQHRYQEDELKLLNVIAHSAGMAIENMKLIKKNIQSQRMAAIGMTAASLSHHFKNILNGLEGSISLLRLGIDNHDEKLMNQAWNILNKNHKRLSSMVLDLLNLAKEDHYQFASYNLTEIILETVELLRPQCEEEHIHLEIDPQLLKHSPLYFEFDSQAIHRVLLNLLTNSIDSVREKHLDSGQGHILISAQTDPSRQQVEISVTDNGIGIPPDQIPYLFEQFRTGKGFMGTGLGLAVSKRIVEGHHGHIKVFSNPTEGKTVFTVVLPLNQNVDITQTFKISEMAALTSSPRTKESSSS